MYLIKALAYSNSNIFLHSSVFSQQLKLHPNNNMVISENYMTVQDNNIDIMPSPTGQDLQHRIWRHKDLRELGGTKKICAQPSH